MLAFQSDFFLFCVLSISVAFFISILIMGCIGTIVGRSLSKEFWKAYCRYDSKAIDLWNNINMFILVGSTLFLSVIFLIILNLYFKPTFYSHCIYKMLLPEEIAELERKTDHHLDFNCSFSDFYSNNDISTHDFETIMDFYHKKIQKEDYKRKQIVTLKNQIELKNEQQKLEKELNDLKEKYKNSESEIDFEYE